MTAPTCPNHGTPMSPPKGKGFSWYCPQKMPDGSWCPYKVKAEKQAPAPGPAQIVAPGASQGPPSDEAVRLRICEALLKGGAGTPDEVLYHAKAFFEWVKEGK